MPTIFSHAVASLAIGSVHPAKERPWKFWLLGMLCSIIPDADVIGFRLIAYDSFWGHRGFTHSLSFALVFGLIITLIFYRKTPLLSKQWWGLCLFFVICTASHGILDAFTTGGMGVAFFAPIENKRYFAPDIWRKVRVSPIGARAFFSEWGMRTMKSEFLWIWLPSGVVIFLSAIWRKMRQ